MYVKHYRTFNKKCHNERTALEGQYEITGVGWGKGT